MADFGQFAGTVFEPPTSHQPEEPRTTFGDDPKIVAALARISPVPIARVEPDGPLVLRRVTLEREDGEPIAPAPIISRKHRPTKLGAVPGRMSVHSVRDVEGDADAQPVQDSNDGGGVMKFNIDEALPPGTIVPQLNVAPPAPPTDSVKVSMVGDGYVATGQTMELGLNDPAVKQIAPDKALTTEGSVAAVLLDSSDLIAGDEEEAPRSLAVEKDIRRTNPDLGRVSARPPTTEVTPNPSKLPVADKATEAVKPEDDAVDGQPTTVWEKGSITPPPQEKLPAFDLEETGTTPQTPKGKGTMLGLKPPSAPPRPPTRQTQQAEVSSPAPQEPETSQEVQPAPAKESSRRPPPPPSSRHPVAEKVETAEVASTPTQPRQKSGPPPLPRSNPPQGGPLTEAGVGVPQRLPTEPPPSVMGTPVRPLSGPPPAFKSAEFLEAESFARSAGLVQDDAVEQRLAEIEEYRKRVSDVGAKLVLVEAMAHLSIRKSRIESDRRHTDLLRELQETMKTLGQASTPAPAPVAPQIVVNTDALAKAMGQQTEVASQIAQQGAEMLTAVRSTPAPQVVVNTDALAEAMTRQTEQNAVIASAMANVLQSQGRPVPQELVALAQPEGASSMTKTQKLFVAVAAFASVALLATMFLKWF